MTSYCWNRNTGKDAFDSRDYDTALTSFSKAISLDANKSKYYGSRAEALLELDDIEGAREAVEEGLRHTNSRSAELLELAEQISTLTLRQKG